MDYNNNVFLILVTMQDHFFEIKTVALKKVFPIIHLIKRNK